MSLTEAFNLTETVIPARDEKQSWVGEGTFDLSGDTLKLESDGVEYARIEIPVGVTYRFKIGMHVERL